MNTPKYSPGPWKACGGGLCSCAQVWTSNHPVAMVERGEWGDDFPQIRVVYDPHRQEPVNAIIEATTAVMDYGRIPEETATANCRLIAAAPELLEALHAIVQFNDECAADDGIGFDPTGPLMSNAREVIALALGNVKLPRRKSVEELLPMSMRVT